MTRERKTVSVMIHMYCRGNHGTKAGLCESCSELMEYSNVRLDKCRLKENKPTCANCTVHCYKPSMREKIRDVMRYSGPRMLFNHPIMAIQHLIDGRRNRKH
jgi:hypothetical protein